MGNLASQISSSQFASGALTLTVASGNSIRVCGIHFTGAVASATIFTVTDNDDTTLYTVHLLTGGTSYEISAEVVYSNGLKIVSDKVAASCAVFHTSAGN